MLAWIGENLTQFFGPFRLLTSYLFRAGLGAALGAVVTFLILPKLWNRLPTDQGRAYAVGAAKSKGKPVAGGVIFVPLFCIICFLVMPEKPALHARRHFLSLHAGSLQRGIQDLQ